MNLSVRTRRAKAQGIYKDGDFEGAKKNFRKNPIQNRTLVANHSERAILKPATLAAFQWVRNLDKRLQAEFLRLRASKSLTKASDEEVYEKAKENLKKSDIEVVQSFKDKKDKELASRLVDKYLSDYSIESISERNTLQEVIRLEVIQNRLHEKLEDLYTKNDKALSLQTLEQIYRNGNEIVKLKNTLGLSKPKDVKLAPYDAYQHALKRWRTWREENQASRTKECPYCQKIIWWKMRTEAWELRKHPFFQDKMVYNKKLFASLGQTVTIDEKFIADVLEVSVDYIPWVLSKVQRKPPTITEGEPSADITVNLVTDGGSDGNEEKASEEIKEEVRPDSERSSN
jgi:hypothetical protein